MKTRNIFWGALALVSYANAGTLNLYANANVGEYSVGATTVLASNSNAASGIFSGAGAFGPVFTSASINDTATGAQATTHQQVSANILSEGVGSISYAEGWDATNLQNGYANVYATQPGASATSTYAFNTSGPSTLHVTFTSSFTSTGSSNPAFGLWNPLISVDGVTYNPVPSGKWITPLASGGYDFAMATGGPHTLGIYAFSNVSGGLLTQSMQLNETVNFSTTAGVVPEPTSIVGLATLAVGLLKRRSGK